MAIVKQANPNAKSGFMGVGSTGIASLALERKFIGFELDEVYFNASKERIEIRKF